MVHPWVMTALLARPYLLPCSRSLEVRAMKLCAATRAPAANAARAARACRAARAARAAHAQLT